MPHSTDEDSKRALIDGLHAARQSILDALGGVPPDRFGEVALDEWSVLDLLAHVVGWDFTNLKAAQEIQAGQLPSFYTYWDKDWRSYNALLINLYKRADPIEQVAEIEESYARLVEYLETVPAADFSRDHGVRFKGIKVTIERLLKAETEDERVHAAQIHDFAARKPR
jgi:hypothetical protein